MCVCDVTGYIYAAADYS